MGIKQKLLIISVLALSTSANAAMVVMNDSGEIAGIDGLLYQGESWDVRFSNQGVLASDYNFWGAQQSSLHGVLQDYIQSEQYGWRDNVPWIAGCYSHASCEIWTAREEGGIHGTNLVYAHQIHLTGSVSGVWLTSSLENMYDQSGTVTWTNFSPSPVPVPAAVWLFGSGLIGLIGVARRKES